MSRACTPVLVGVASSVSEIWLPFKNSQFSLSGQVHGHRKIYVECMHASFGGCGFFDFGDMATFQKRPNFPFGAWTIVHGHQKI